MIQSGLQTFIEVGNALCEIRDAELYRKKYGTFENYCRERWGFTDERARLLMRSSEVVKVITSTPTVVGVAPVNESQARPLTKLDTPEQQREAWQEAVATSGGKPTAKFYILGSVWVSI